MPLAICMPSSASALKNTRSSNSISKNLCPKEQLIKRRPPATPVFTLASPVIASKQLSLLKLSYCCSHSSLLYKQDIFTYLFVRDQHLFSSPFHTPISILTIQSSYLFAAGKLCLCYFPTGLRPCCTVTILPNAILSAASLFWSLCVFSS